MKFRYNYLENRLWWKLDEEYSYEISEENHFRTPEGTYGSDGFHLGEKEWIVFKSISWIIGELQARMIKVIYQKGEKTYQKILDLPNTEEIILEFAFTEDDLT